MDDALSFLNRRWVPRSASLPPGELVARYGLRIAGLLAARGVKTAAEAEAFLDPGLHRLSDPFGIHQMEAAAARIASAIRRGETVVIYGDYDVDGQASAALVWRVIRDLGGKAATYVPNRLAEGYGLNVDALSRLCEEGATVVLTVDCGVTSIAEAAWAAEHGLDLVVTDHHEPGPEVPEAVAVVNPKLGAPEPMRELAGAGVAFKLAEALGEALGKGRTVAHRYVELAALGTIADVVPLLGENRSLAAAGLDRLNRDPQVPGLAALKAVSRIEGDVTAYHVAFGLGPRLNAAGRIADASAGVALLTEDDPESALAIAEQLDRDNEERRRIERLVDEQADRFLRDRGDPGRERALVAWGEGWHPGVVGIVAARIAERYYRPAVVLTVEGERARGSARGIPGLNLFEALSCCSELFEAFGGHEGAAGMTLRSERLEEFRERFCAAVSERIGDRALVPVLAYEEVVGLDELTLALAEEAERLAPFGAGNPSPVFVARGVELKARPVGKDQSHLKFTILREGTTRSVDGIGFGLAEKVAERLEPGGRYDIAFVPQVNEWNGTRSFSAQVRDVRRAEAALSGAPASRVEVAAARDPVALRDPIPSPRNVNVVDRRGVEPRRVLDELFRAGRPACLIAEAGGERLAESVASLGYGRRIAVASGPRPGVSSGWAERALAGGERRLAAALMDIPVDVRELANRLGSLFEALDRAGAALDLYLAFRPGDGAALYEGVARRYPDRERLGRLYVSLKSEFGDGEPFTPGRAFGAVERKWPGTLAFEGVRLGIEVFAELGLVAEAGGRYRLSPRPGGKVDLERSLRYNECTRTRERLIGSRRLVAEAPPDHFLSRLWTLSQEPHGVAGLAAGG